MSNVRGPSEQSSSPSFFAEWEQGESARVHREEHDVVFDITCAYCREARPYLVSLGLKVWLGGQNDTSGQCAFCGVVSHDVLLGVCESC